MANIKQQKIGAIYKVAAFLAFIMLGYLCIRGYKNSVEKLKINACIDEIGILMRNIQQTYRNEFDYSTLNYERAVTLNIIPKQMMRPGYREAVNSYIGGVDFYYSSLHEIDDSKAFEISFQGLTSAGCKALMRIAWDEGDNVSFIAVAGYPTPMPSGVLDEVLMTTKQESIKDPHVFRAATVRFVGEDKINNACACSGNNCSVIWKFF